MRADAEREHARRELQFLQALRLAIPASLDPKANTDFKSRESDLLKLLNADTDNG
ncbi:MAG: hypothetical protein KF715_08665 [Candidatus Didemnitutus sp.]|nr:hypothetical protein [Candidatus Didemnitutus sp.]